MEKRRFTRASARQIDHGNVLRKQQANQRARVLHARNAQKSERRYCWRCDALRTVCEREECGVRKVLERQRRDRDFGEEVNWKDVGSESVFTSPRLREIEENYADRTGSFGESVGIRREQAQRHRAFLRGEEEIRDERLT